MEGARIMVVEDEGLVGRQLQKELKRFGYEVPCVVRTGEEAIERADELRPDLILMDIRLGGALDGIDTASRIHQRLDVPITFLTSYVDEGTLSRAKAAAPAGYLLKPFDPRELRSTIEVVLERQRLERERAALLEIMREITGSFDSQEILLRVERHTAEIVPCDIVATVYEDPPGGGFRLISHHGAEEGSGADLEALYAALDRRLQESGKSILAGNPTADPWLPQDLVQRLELAALIVVPLQVRRRGRGALLACARSRRFPFDESRVQLLEAIAAQLAACLEAADLFAEQEEAAAVARAVAYVSQQMISALDTPALLQRLCEVTSQVLASDWSQTLLWDANARAFVPVASYGANPEEWEAMRVLHVSRDGGKSGSGMRERLARGEVLEVDPARLQDVPGVALATRYGVTACLDIPLRHGDELVGIQTAYYRGRQHRTLPWQQRIARGISEVASLALANARLVGKLEEANRLKTDFVATMSHELRNPASGIMGYADLLLAGEFGELAPQQAEVVGKVAASAARLHEILTDTLDVSRLDTGHAPLHLREVELGSFVAEIVAEVGEQLRKPALSLVADVDRQTPPLWTDATKLRVVLKNLLSNAIKFTERGYVILSAQQRDGHIVFEVVDTGIGIAADKLPTVFEPFEQIERATSQKYGGVGLGLYIVRRLIDLLGGTIAAESQQGRGTIFTVTIPLRPPAT